MIEPVLSRSSSPPPISLPALFGQFLRFGCAAFGGPVAQIAMVRAALVDQQGWISKERFNRLLAVFQVLPGPEAHELCVHLGMIARGRLGGVLAGLGFMLPGLVLMMVAGWLYTSVVSGIAGIGGVLLGVQIVVLAIIARAVVRIGQHIIEDRLLAAIAVAGLAAALAGLPFWITLAAAGACYALWARPALVALVLAGAAALALLLRGAASADPIAVAQAPATVLALFVAGLKGGLLTFGGAYTAIPYVRADTVGRGWLSDATFLDGVAIAGVLPAPLVIFATFTGYVAGGPVGALAITAGMFLPAFAFSLLFFERLEAVVENPALHRLLAVVAAAVVGIIAATLFELAAATAPRVTQPPVGLVLFAVGLVAAWRLKGLWVPILLIALGAAAGALLPI
ncbi:chromate transporter [Sphingomonas guangdongensis]|uniref:Chromate transporter n=1 Tax=Sphingomonas guangdongensis TaxID=1141890 RepID=A0A285QXE9_9SPHN|nr:chromate efflux transporter [Sphingomonas guangdongensis]SOB86593.1 chromate transporter [Sphingomonas guangdongensis]